LKHAFENAALCPSTEALVHDLPVAETRRQVTPGDSRSIPVKNGFDEQPVIRCVAADMAFTAGQKILDPLPLIVSQSKALHGPALRKADLASITRQLILESPTYQAALQNRTAFRV